MVHLKGLDGLGLIYTGRLLRNEREMAPLSTDVIVGFAALAVAAVAIYLFVRATSGTSSEKQDDSVAITVDDGPLSHPLTITSTDRGGYKIPKAERHLRSSEVERARSKIRTLALQRELLSMVLKRLFEAEDEGEITREERLSLSKGYEVDLKRLQDDLKQSELIVTLHELETIRDDILKKFEATLNTTQSRIDNVLKELKIQEKPQRAPRRMPSEKEEETEEEEGETEEEEAPRRKPRSDVEEKLEQLRMEVLKELEELERLELEV